MYFGLLSLPQLSAFPYNTGIFVTSISFFLSSMLVLYQHHTSTHTCAHIYTHTLPMFAPIPSSLLLLQSVFMPIFAKKMHIQIYAASFFFFFKKRELFYEFACYTTTAFQFFILLYSWTSIRHVLRKRKNILPRIFSIIRNKLIKFQKDKNHI